MKKPRSLQPALSRIRKRLSTARNLPIEQQATYYYFDGTTKNDFCSALEDGHQSAIRLALDILAADLPLQTENHETYIRAIRTALRNACAADLLNPANKKTLLSIEYRHLQRLTIQAHFSTPGAEQQQARRQLTGHQECMQKLFGHIPPLNIKLSDLPPTTPPTDLFQKAGNNKLLPPTLITQLCSHSAELFYMLIHSPEDYLPGSHLHTLSPAPHGQSLCYFLHENNDLNAPYWSLAPWNIISDYPGFALAADASFYRLIDDYGNIHGYTI